VTPSWFRKRGPAWLRLIGAVLLLGCLPTRAQEQGTEAGGEGGVINSVPGPVSGVTPPLSAEGEGRQTNVMLGSVRVSSFYDDNALNRAAGQVGDFQYAISPSIAFQQLRRRSSWNLSYDGGASVNQRVLGRNLVTHNASAGLKYRLTRRATVQLRQNYLVSSDPFDRIGESRFLPALAGVGQLNSFVVTPIGTRIAFASKADFTYQIGRHSLVGASGSFSTLKERDVPGAVAVANRLLDTRNLNGRVYYAQRVSRRQNMGVEYDVQDLRFNGSSGRTSSNGLFYFEEITLTPRLKVSFSLGPQRSHTHNDVRLSFLGLPVVVPLLHDEWSWAGSGNFTWQGNRTALRAGGQRGVSDGGGLGGAIRLQSITVEVRRKLTARWSASVAGSYASGRSLVTGASGAITRLGDKIASISLERRLAPNLGLQLRYARWHQALNMSAGEQLPLDHNRAEIGLTYEFTRPWGSSR